MAGEAWNADLIPVGRRKRRERVGGVDEGRGFVDNGARHSAIVGAGRAVEFRKTPSEPYSAYPNSTYTAFAEPEKFDDQIERVARALRAQPLSPQLRAGPPLLLPVLTRHSSEPPIHPLLNGFRARRHQTGDGLVFLHRGK